MFSVDKDYLEQEFQLFDEVVFTYSSLGNNFTKGIYLFSIGESIDSVIVMNYNGRIIQRSGAGLIKTGEKTQKIDKRMLLKGYNQIIHEIIYIENDFNSPQYKDYFKFMNSRLNKIKNGIETLLSDSSIK